MAASTTVESLTERLQRNPDSFVFSRLADHYRKTGNVDQAIDLCVKGLDRYPDSSIGHLILGRCYLEQEKFERAVNEFINVCHIDRRNTVAIKMLADIFMRQGLLEKAADLYIILAKIDPFDALRTRTSRPKKGSGASDLFEILGLSPALKSPSGAGAPAAGRGGFADFDRLPPVRPPAQAGTAKESTQFVSLDDLGLSQADTVVADIGSATEELLSNASTITGSDISDRMSALFGEAPTAPPPRPAPEQEPPAAVFEVTPLPEKPRQEDTSHKETIKMPSLKEPPKAAAGAAGGMSLNIELEETMIIDADEAMLLRGGSGGRAKDSIPAEIDILEKKIIDDEKSQELASESIPGFNADELAGKPQESLDDIVSAMQKETSAEAEAPVEAAIFEPPSALPVARGEEEVPVQPVKETVEKDRDIIALQPEPPPEAMVRAGETGKLVEDDVEKTAVFLHPADDTISGDDIVERLEGIFNDKKEKPSGKLEKTVKKLEKESAVKAEKVQKAEETDRSDAPVKAPAAAEPAGPETACKKDDSVVETVSLVSGSDVEKRLDEIFQERKDPVKKDTTKKIGKITKKEEETAVHAAPAAAPAVPAVTGPERTVVEIPLPRPVQPALVIPDTAAEDQTETYEETLILESPSDALSGSLPEEKKPEPEIRAQPATGSAVQTDETLASATQLEDIDIDTQPTAPQKPIQEEDGKESTAVFEEFSPALVPQTPEPAPEVPVFEPAPSSDDTVWDLASAMGDKKEKTDSIPDQVMTPTIADIYFKQGQPQLALNIYRRLADKNPDNLELRQQIQELEKMIASGIDNLKPPAPKRSRARKKPPSREPAPPEKTESAKEATVTEILPLAGVRLRKRVHIKLKKNDEAQE